MELYIIVIILLIGYGAALYRWDKSNLWRLGFNKSRLIKRIHYALLGLVFLDLIICLTSGFHYRGLWTSRIFIFGYLISGLIIYPIAAKQIFNRLEKIYFLIFGFSPVGLGLFLIIPFIGVLMTVSIGVRLINPADRIFYEDSNIRIQQTFIGVLGQPQLDLIEKKLIFEELNQRYSGFYVDSYDSLYIKYDTDSIRINFSRDQENYQDDDLIIDEDIFMIMENKTTYRQQKIYVMRGDTIFESKHN